MGGDTYWLLAIKVSLASYQLSVIGEMFFARKVLDIHTSPALGDSESLGGLWLSSHKLTYPRFPSDATTSIAPVLSLGVHSWLTPSICQRSITYRSKWKHFRRFSQIYALLYLPACIARNHSIVERIQAFC